MCRRTVALGVIAVILASIAFSAPSAAHADGDPASDILVSSRLFQPIDLSLPAATVAQLNAELSASARAGFQIRVALISSATDLGTIPQLFSEPAQDYADYLGSELANLYGGQILVVMPRRTGFGLYGPAHGPNALTFAELHDVQAVRPGPGIQLARAALSAIPLLARADGHPFAVGGVHVAPVTAAPSKLPAAGWCALVVGMALVVICWRASLRARPLSTPQRLES